MPGTRNLVKTKKQTNKKKNKTPKIHGGMIIGFTGELNSVV